MALIYKEYTLNDIAVETISADLQNYLNRRRMERRDVQRVRLTVEELLLNILEHCGKNIQISAGIGKQFGRHLFRLRYKGAPFDPTRSSENPWSDDLMRTLGYFPSWSHRGKVNTVSLVLADRPKHSTVFYIICALLAAALLGFAGSFFTDTLRQSLSGALLTPLADGFLGLLTTFSGVMIALTVCSGLLGMGDSAATARMGRSVLLRFVGISFAVSAAATTIALPFLKLNFSANVQGDSSQIDQISRMFFDILPSNIVEPFQTGNALQIIVIALFVGIALIAIGERGSRIRGLVDESASLMQRTVSMICSLVPVFIFVILLRQIWSGEIKALLSIFKPILLIIAAVLVISAAMWLISALRLKCSPILLIKKVLPPFLIAVTSGSSMSAMTLSMETCEKKLGVKKSAVYFMYPLGSVMFRPAGIIYYAVLVCTLAEIYQIEISLSWLFMAVVISTLLIIALPPIPGSALLGFTILFNSLGIPSDALVLATAMDIIIDFVDTGFNVMLLNLQIACEAESFDDLDRAILLDKLQK